MKFTTSLFALIAASTITLSSARSTNESNINKFLPKLAEECRQEVSASDLFMILIWIIIRIFVKIFY